MDFVILRKIAEGTCAEVYLVRLKQKQVATSDGSEGIAVLKLAKPGYENPAIVEAVELRRIASCGMHPHIVTVLGYYEGNGIPRGILLEYCSGGSLGEHLRGGLKKGHATAPPDIDEDTEINNRQGGNMCTQGTLSETVQTVTIPIHVARRLFVHLIDALLFLEAMKLWHRDLKPDNILLTSLNLSEASLKLSDFGFARRTPHSELRVGRRGAAGSPAYMSPERLHQFIISTQGGSSVDNDDGFKGSMSYCRSKAEVWAAGLILYEMVCGCRLLGPVRSLEDLKNAHANVLNLLQTDSRLSRPGAEVLLDLLQSLLQPDPSNRLALQEVRDHPWLQFETGTPTPLRTPPVPTMSLDDGDVFAPPCTLSVERRSFCSSGASVESMAGSAARSEMAASRRYLSDAKSGETGPCSEEMAFSSYAMFSETPRSSFVSIHAVGLIPTSSSTSRLKSTSAVAAGAAPVLTATAPPLEDDDEEEAMDMGRERKPAWKSLWTLSFDLTGFVLGWLRVAMRAPHPHRCYGVSFMY